MGLGLGVTDDVSAAVTELDSEPAIGDADAVLESAPPELLDGGALLEREIELESETENERDGVDDAGGAGHLSEVSNCDHTQYGGEDVRQRVEPHGPEIEPLWQLPATPSAVVHHPQGGLQHGES